jgi:hypothetical protein
MNWIFETVPVLDLIGSCVRGDHSLRLASDRAAAIFPDDFDTNGWALSISLRRLVSVPQSPFSSGTNKVSATLKSNRCPELETRDYSVDLFGSVRRPIVDQSAILYQRFQACSRIAVRNTGVTSTCKAAYVAAVQDEPFKWNRMDSCLIWSMQSGRP